MNTEFKQLYKFSTDLSKSFFNKTQKKSFKRWIHHYLPKKLSKGISTISHGLENGVALLYILEGIEKQSICEYNTNPKSKKKKIQNLQLVLEHCRSKSIPVQITFEDILCNRIEKIMPFIFKIMIYSAVRNLSVKEDLDFSLIVLEWCKNKAQAYNLKMVSFQESFKDGRLFSALLYNETKGLVNHSSLSPVKLNFFILQLFFFLRSLFRFYI
ncbi:cortexillin-2 [Anaeramoeba flamelloides]|uniref:Cortexillin-2 n=1 Tax=Anaeramoeba flamelloides TaxID=1746091 RepID=A0AAV7Y9A0_9EUKA|nr:cortexillin-2 [Anaeramoeba flamelloides]